jgi:ribosome maturation protein Sdo1
LQSFGTDDVDTCLKTIVLKGEIQFTTAERKDKVDRKRAEIVNYIHK